MQLAQHLLQHVIKPSLAYMGCHQPSIQALLLATAAIESDLGRQAHQQAHQRLGLYQVHPLSHRHLWDKFLVQDAELASRVRGLASQHVFLLHPHQELALNQAYATAIAYCLYRQHGLPAKISSDPKQLLQLWQAYYRHPHSPSLELAQQRFESIKDWPCCQPA